MLRLLIPLILAWPLIKWAIAIRYPEVLRRVEGVRSERALTRQWGEAKPNPMVKEIGIRLMRASNQRAVIKVLPGDLVNAVALPHRRIFVWQGLLDLVGENEDMIAGVVAHELGHLAGEHYLKQIRKLTMAQFVFGMFGGGWFRSMVKNLAFRIVSAGFSREQEEEADRTAVDFMKRAGFDPEGLARLFESLAARAGREPIGLLGTHPEPRARAARVRLLAQQ